MPVGLTQVVVRTSQSGLIPDTPNSTYPELSGLIPDTEELTGVVPSPGVTTNHRTSKSGLLPDISPVFSDGDSGPTIASIAVEAEQAVDQLVESSSPM